MHIDKFKWVYIIFVDILWITYSTFYSRTKAAHFVKIIYAAYFPTSHSYAQHYFKTRFIQAPPMLHSVGSFRRISIVYFAQIFLPSCLRSLCWLWQRSRNISYHYSALKVLPAIWLQPSARPSQLYCPLGFCQHSDRHAGLWILSNWSRYQRSFFQWYRKQ